MLCKRLHMSAYRYSLRENNFYSNRSNLSHLCCVVKVNTPHLRPAKKDVGKQCSWGHMHAVYMVTSSNANIFRVAGPLCRNSPVTGEFPSQRPVTQSFDISFDLQLNKQLNKQPWRWWFETSLGSLWRHCNEKNITNCISSIEIFQCQPRILILVSFQCTWKTRWHLEACTCTFQTAFWNAYLELIS